MSSSMSSQKSRSLAGRLQCHCGVPASLRTSTTTANPNRDFYNCTMHSCNFFCWFDELPDAFIPAQFNLLRNKLDSLVKANHSLREDVKELKQIVRWYMKLVIGILLVVVLLVQIFNGRT